MSISQVMMSMKNTNWNLTDDFSVLIIPNNPDFYLEKNLTNLPSDPTTFFKSTAVAVNLPDITTGNQIEHYVGGEYVIQNSIPQVFRFSIRFRDINNGEFRRWFELLYAYSQYAFGIDSYLNIYIYDSKYNKLLYGTSKALIDSLPGPQYDTNNTNAQEFEVQFKSAYLSDDYLMDFGSMMYISNWPSDVEESENTESA